MSILQLKHPNYLHDGKKKIIVSAKFYRRCWLSFFEHKVDCHKDYTAGYQGKMEDYDE